MMTTTAAGPAACVAAAAAAAGVGPDALAPAAGAIAGTTAATTKASTQPWRSRSGASAHLRGPGVLVVRPLGLMSVAISINFGVIGMMLNEIDGDIGEILVRVGHHDWSEGLR
jgi:hypothetical protein